MKDSQYYANPVQCSNQIDFFIELAIPFLFYSLLSEFQKESIQKKLKHIVHFHARFRFDPLTKFSALDRSNGGNRKKSDGILSNINWKQ